MTSPPSPSSSDIRSRYEVKKGISCSSQEYATNSCRMVERPNVAVVVLDTARAKDTVPADPAVTPALAALAKSGTEYQNAFSSAPWTLPSHASLFTGTYPTEHGAHGDHTYLDGSLRTIADIFREAGYETVGVSNNTWITDEFGFSRGFETFRTGRECTRSNDGSTNSGLERSITKLKHSVHTLATRTARQRGFLDSQQSTDNGGTHTTDWIKRWISDRNTQNPFFLFVNYIEPHAEYRPSRKYAERFLPEDATYEEAMAVRQDPRGYDVGQYDLSDRELALLRALYRAEIASVDAYLGRLTDSLLANERETILVVMGDHGENIGDHGLFGHQYSTHDTVLHVPLIVHGGAFAGGKSNTQLVQPLDLPPTLLDAAGINAPEARKQFSGRSIHPTVDTEAREQVFAEYISPQPSIAALKARFGELPDQFERLAQTRRTVRTTEEKLVRRSDGTMTYYRVDDDPMEQTNLVGKRPVRVAALENQLDEWQASIDRTTVSTEVSISDTTERRLADLGYR